MFKNLKAEMARAGFTNENIANVVGVDTKTISNKMTGKTEWTRREMCSIKKNMFPSCTLDYLFLIE